MNISKCSVLLCLFAFCSSALADPPKLGVSLALSGEAAGEGSDVRSILTFANRSAGNPFTLVFEDDRCAEKDAVSAAHKLVDVDKAAGVIGYVCSGAFLGAAPIFERARVPALGVVTGAPAISSAGDFIFRTTPSLAVAAAKLRAHAEQHFKSVAVLSENTAYALGLAEAFKKAGGDAAVIDETFNPGASDFKSFFTKFISRGVEAIFLNPQAEPNFIEMYRQLKQLGWKGQVYGTYYPGFAAFQREFGAQADGVIFADLPFIESALSADGVRLYRRFVERYGKLSSSEFYFVTAMTGFQALHEALMHSPDRKEQLSYLYSHMFQSPFGSFRFDKNGDALGEHLTFVLKQVKEGKSAAFADASAP